MSGGSAPQPSNRGFLLLLIFLGVALLLVGRLAYLQIFAASSYAQRAEEQRTRTVDLPATRGTIYDRNGRVLASTVPATTVYCDPQEVTDAHAEAEQIASVLGGDSAEYLDKLTREGSFVYIAKKIDTDVADSLEALGLDGIHLLDDPRRVYPYNGIGNQVIGVTNSDGEGVSGLELQYEDLLGGTDGMLIEQRGLGDMPIVGGTRTELASVDGTNIITTIDIDLQQYIEERLAQAISDTAATGGSITVYDGKTGEIYASASTPLLSTGDNWRDSQSEAFNLRTITGVYEPGSTFKAATAAALVDMGVVTPGTVFHVPPYLQFEDFTISDHEPHGEIDWTFKDIIAQSSNIGTVLASQKVSDLDLLSHYEAYGFTESTGVDFPGAATGWVPDLGKWTSATAANVPFGQGISVSVLQMVRLYGAFVNDGSICTPHFLLDIPSDQSSVPDWETGKVMESGTVGSVTEMLEAVVTEGTAQGAAIDGYTVAGKSGTAQYIVADTGTYSDDDYITSFVGYLPNTGSGFVVMVTLEQTGASTSGIFADVMRHVAEQYGISPG